MEVKFLLTLIIEVVVRKIIPLLVLTFCLAASQSITFGDFLIDDFSSLATPSVPGGSAGSPAMNVGDGNATVTVGVTNPLGPGMEGNIEAVNNSYVFNSNPTRLDFRGFIEYDFGASTIAQVSGGNPQQFLLPISGADSDWRMKLLYLEGNTTVATIYGAGSANGDPISTSFPNTIMPGNANKIRLEFAYTGDFLPTGSGATLTFGGPGQSFTAVPEPASLLMFSSALFALTCRRRRK
jgi:hypothetical protein